MSNFDKYVLFLCLTVFAALASLFAALIARDVKNTLKMIEGGLSDKEIIQGLRKKKGETETFRRPWYTRENRFRRICNDDFRLSRVLLYLENQREKDGEKYSVFKNGAKRIDGDEIREKRVFVRKRSERSD